MAPETVPRADQPAWPCRLTVVVGIEPADRAEASTSSVPVAGCRRGSARRSPTTSSAARAPPAHRSRGLGSCLAPRLRPAAVPRRDVVDVSGAELSHRMALDLNHVLGVLLSAVREI